MLLWSRNDTGITSQIEEILIHRSDYSFLNTSKIGVLLGFCGNDFGIKKKIWHSQVNDFCVMLASYSHLLWL